MNIGATLIERMAVVVILWILTSMFFPNFHEAIARAWSAREKANARIEAYELQKDQIDGKAPPVKATPPPETGIGYHGPGWQGMRTNHQSPLTTSH